MGYTMCCWRYSIVALFFVTLTQAQQFHPPDNQYNQGLYTQHTVFTNPLHYPHQSSRVPSTAPGFYHPGVFSPRVPQVRPNFHHHNQQNQHFFNEFLAGDNNRRIPFDGPLFSPANGFEPTETPGQLENYHKALQEILEEQFGITGGGNNSNQGSNNVGGDQLNFNLDFLGGTSFVRVRQSFGDKKSNYDYHYAV